MNDNKKLDKKSRTLIGIYRSSLGISLTALTIVAVLEIFMLIYTNIDPALFGQYIWTYRIFYISLLTLALIYIGLNLYVKKDISKRYVMLNIANPICAVFFFGWALGITYFDASKYGTVDAMVFMTFSLIVPLGFYLEPLLYVFIVIAADILMLSLTVLVIGSAAAVINLSIFFIFQLVLGFSFLRLKRNLGKQIVEEQENAEMDVMTGFCNRRVYQKDMDQYEDKGLRKDLTYIVIDIDGLKSVNDNYGHDAGDRLIIGAAQCMEQSFGIGGKLYRIGGDEFVILYFGDPDDLENRFNEYQDRMKIWSEENELALSTSYGYVCQSEYPDSDMIEFARVADKRMYHMKELYYQQSGKNRQKCV